MGGQADTCYIITKLQYFWFVLNNMTLNAVMNPEKLKAMQESVRIGGKGTARLKKLAVNNIPGIEETNMIMDDGSVIHFNNPKVQASIAANTFAISGHAEKKQIADMLPGILNQL